MIQNLWLKGKGKAQGFTLLEVMVSLFILSIIFTTIYGSFFTTHSIVTDLKSRIKSHRTLRAALQVVTKDLRSAYFILPDTVTRFKGEDITKKIISPFLSFSAYTPYQREGSSNTLMVEYFLKRKDDREDLILIRSSRSKDFQDEIEEEVLVEGVETLDISYFDGKEWKRKWNSELTKSLPKGVKLTISVKSFTLNSVIPIEGGQFG
jgi:type II secretion system protein J